MTDQEDRSEVSAAGERIEKREFKNQRVRVSGTPALPMFLLEQRPYALSHAEWIQLHDRRNWFLDVGIGVLVYAFGQVSPILLKLVRREILWASVTVDDRLLYGLELVVGLLLILTGWRRGGPRRDVKGRIDTHFLENPAQLKQRRGRRS